jgi:hypothetical protein
LVEPLDATLNGRRTFRWSANVTLQANQRFELVFWLVGQDPLRDSFGPVGASTETAITVNLDKTVEVLPDRLMPGHDYEWGVLLVEVEPYQRLQFLGGGHRFHFELSGGGGGGGRSGSPATPTPRGD